MLLRAYVGDITKVTTDCIVNAAKRTLEGGGGVDGAIHDAAGPGLLEECRSLPDINDGSYPHPIHCYTGGAVVTGGHNLPTKHVIHTVGPVYKDDSKLASSYLNSCYHNSMERAISGGFRSIAFPAISTGIYGYPLIDATIIAVDSMEGYWGVDIEVHFVCYDKPTLLVYKQIIDLSVNGWEVKVVG